MTDVPRPPRLIQPEDAWELQPPAPGGPEAAGGAASVPTPLRPSAVILPPDQYAPPGSQPLYAIGNPTVVGPGPGAVAVLPGSGTVLQDPQRARVSSFVCQVLNLLATSVITFTLRVGGAPYPGCRRTVPASPLAVALFPFDVYVLAGQGQTIDVMVQVDDGGAYTLQAFYEGWVFPAAAMTRYYAAVAAALG